MTNNDGCLVNGCAPLIAALILVVLAIWWLL